MMSTLTAKLSTRQASVVWLRSIPRWAIPLTVGVIACALIISRRPDAVFNAQFWGEDGRYWFGDAYRLGGFQALFRPVNGYFVTDARLAGWLASFFPLTYGPLIFNSLAIVIQTLPAVFIVSGRLDAVIPNRYLQAFLAFLYVATPNAWEIQTNITNAQWHLAFLAFLVLIASRPSGRAWRVFDIAVITLTGLSGPYALVLAPIMGYYWWKTRSSWTAKLFVVNGVTALIQSAVLLVSVNEQRGHWALGASVSRFVRILGGQVYAAGTIGVNNYALHLTSTGRWFTWWLPTLVTGAGLALMLYAVWKGPLELKLLLAYGALVFAAALKSPYIGGTKPQWQVMILPEVAARYEYLLIIGWLATLVWLICQRKPLLLRGAALLLLVGVLLIGIPADWRYPSFLDLHFYRYAAQFNAMPSGSSIAIPINPGWAKWTLHLVKH